MEKVKIGLIALICGISFQLFAQKDKTATPGGRFSLGVRSTLSAFNDHPDETIGTGVGGQFRVQLSDRIQTEWFADYLNSGLGNYALRYDYHIGWSVMYYLIPSSQKPKFQPYILAGHCFDYTRITGKSIASMREGRWSSAVQAGIGTHYHLTPALDVSLSAQYMMHLGSHLHGHLKPNGDFHIHEEKTNGIEGHVLFNLSFNIKIAELW